jgi:hypothetical protein
MQKCDLVRLGFALEQGESKVATEKRATLASPSPRLAATEPTPAMVMTPSAMQAMNT